jgi:hypothetical protein
MSHTVPSQHPAVVLRSNYQHLRALLAIAAAVILGLTVAVVVLATNNDPGTVASSTTRSVSQASPSAETGAKLDHSGRNTTVTHATGRLANYPDAPPSATTPRPSVRYYLDQAASGSVSQIHYLGPRQVRAGLNPQSTQR